MAKSDRDEPRKATEVDKAIGARMRARRLEIGMSQSALAEEIGITFQQIQKYEQGTNRVAASTLARIAEALSVPIVALMPEPLTPGGDTVLEDPELVAMAPLFAELNAEGRRMLMSVARTFVQDPKLRKSPRRRGD